MNELRVLSVKICISDLRWRRFCSVSLTRSGKVDKNDTKSFSALSSVDHTSWHFKISGIPSLPTKGSYYVYTQTIYCTIFSPIWCASECFRMALNGPKLLLSFFWLDNNLSTLYFVRRRCRTSSLAKGIILFKAVRTKRQQQHDRESRVINGANWV